MKEFDYDKLVSATDGFSPSRLIGKGSHGYIYKALLDQQIVAIKSPSSSPSSSSSSEQMKKLRNEINVLSSLPSSPNVLSFLGHAAEKGLMVVEYMPNGSLHEFLHVSATPNPPTWLKRIEIALKIARAVHFLHQHSILHRDIKSENILLDSKNEPKLADFGLAVDLTDKTKPAPIPAGTIGYLDPNYTSPENLSMKVDVYSYGVVLLEIVSCRKAMYVSYSPSSIVDWAIPLIKEGKIGEICCDGVFRGSSLRLLRLAARCVSSDVESRPSAGEIAVEIASCLAEPLWISVFRRVVKLKRRRKRLREKMMMTWPSQTCRVK